MQLSAASLLLAAQQSAKAQTPPATTSFARAMSEQGKGAGFTPIDFRQTAKPVPAISQAPSKAPARPGAALDIRV